DNGMAHGRKCSRFSTLSYARIAIPISLEFCSRALGKYQAAPSIVEGPDALRIWPRRQNLSRPAPRPDGSRLGGGGVREAFHLQSTDSGSRRGGGCLAQPRRRNSG